MSVLVHAEIDGDRLEDYEIFSGFLLLIIAGNDSTKATYRSLPKVLMDNPDQRQILLDEPGWFTPPTENRPGALTGCSGRSGYSGVF